MARFRRQLWYPVKWCQKYRLSSEKGTGTKKPWGQGCVGSLCVGRAGKYNNVWLFAKKGRIPARPIKQPFISLYSEFAEEQTKSWSKHR